MDFIRVDTGQLYVIDFVFSIGCGWLGTTFLSHHFLAVKQVLAYNLLHLIKRVTPGGGMCISPQPFPRRNIIGWCWPAVHRSTFQPESVNQWVGMFKICKKDTF